MKRKTVIKSAILVFGVIIIPLLYSYFYLGAFWDPYNTLKSVPVAVVNDDKGAVVNGKTRNLGKEAADELVKDATLKFTETDSTDAESGVRGTKYYAVITFPQNFSQNISTASSANKQTAQIDFEANKKRNYIASQIMKNVVTKVEESARDNVSKEVTSELSAKLNDVPGQLGTLNDGLQKLSDGSNTLYDGASKAADGQVKLSNGITSLNSGISSLHTGSSTITTNLGTLSGGLSQLSTGVNTLSGTVTQKFPTMVSGLAQLNTGAQTLLGQFSAGSTSSPTLYDGTTGIASGTQQLYTSLFTPSKTPSNQSTLTIYDGVTGIENGTQQLCTNLFTHSKTPSDQSTLTIYDGVTGIDGGIQQLYNNLFTPSKTPSDQSTLTVYDGVTKAASGTGSYVSTVNNTLYQMIKNDPSSSALLTGYQTQLAQVQAAYAAATDANVKAQYYQQMTMLANLVTMYSVGISSPDEATFEKTLVQAASADPQKQSVVSGGSQLEAGTQQLASEFNDGGTLKTSVGTLAGQSSVFASQFNDGGKLKTGVETLAGQSSVFASQFNDGGELKTKVQSLVGASSTVASQFKDGGTFKSGVQQLAGGTNTFAGNSGSLNQLTGGIGQLVSVINTMSSGSTQLYNGSQQLTNGLSTALNGSAQAQSGSSQLVSASSQIKDGAKQLSDGLGTAKSGVSDSITKANNELTPLNGLDEYVKAPVSIKEESLNPIPNYGTAFAPYFMSLSLWVGALLIFFGIYLDADERIKVLSRHSNNKFIRVGAFALIGIAQAIILSLIVQFALGLSIDNVPAFYLSCMLISLVFISIVEFLIVNLKDLGKFLSIAFLVLNLTACGGTFPMETLPKFFNIIYPYMPMTYSVNLIKEVTSNFNTANAWKNAGILITIFVVFTALTMLFSVTRKAKVMIKEKLQTEN